jgi:hypothetical protein
MRTGFRTIAGCPLAGVLLGAALFQAAAGAQTHPTADSLLTAAKAQAAQDHRLVFAVFHASWCVWCKRLDKFLDSPGIQPVIDKYFVRAYFTVQEHDDKKTLDTPGGDELLKRLGGSTVLPFFAFLDSQGAMIVNSNEPAGPGTKGGNIGHPSEPHEVDWFLAMLAKAVPAMTAGERGAIESYLRNQEK